MKGLIFTFLNSLHPNISIYILHTVLYFFHLVLAMRICLTIQASFGNYFLCSRGLNK